MANHALIRLARQSEPTRVRAPGSACIWAVGGGKGLSDQEFDVAQRTGVEVRYDSKVTGLALDGPTVVGVDLRTPDGDERLEADAVVLAAGTADDVRRAAPAIAGLDQWYIEMQLGKFRSGLRGRHFDDISGMPSPIVNTVRSGRLVASALISLLVLPWGSMDGAILTVTEPGRLRS